MKELSLLNIPNYYSSYYLYGLSKCTELSFQASEEFKKWNGFPIIIFQHDNNLIVIDNADPVCVREELYEKATIYFATNKLTKNQDYHRSKILPLFPHYPINCWKTYLKIFKQGFFSQVGYKAALRELYILQQRPSFNNEEAVIPSEPYIFFAGSIWKSEQKANRDRAHFIAACKNLPKIKFEGGLIRRSDGNNFNFDEVLSPKNYSPKQFSKMSGRSLIGFNNPAVLGAVSWRFAEYLNSGCAVLSLPWEIEMTEYPHHGKEIHMIGNSEEIEEVLPFLIKNDSYRNKIARGGMEFFSRNCDPLVQAKRILNTSLYN